MRRFLFSALLILALSPAFGGTMMLLGTGNGAPVVSSGCATATTTIARLDGTQDATHNTAYTTLICNLVTEGVWAKLDAMYVFAANDSTNALINLVQSTYNSNVIGAPTFSADHGYTGADASGTLAVNTQFNPITAASPNYTQNASHVSVWSGTNVASTGTGGVAIGLGNTALAAPNTTIFPRYSTGAAFYRINDGTSSLGITTADSLGFYLANRSNSTTQQGYKNAVNQSVASQTSGTVPSAPIYILAANAFFTSSSHVTFGYGGQVMMATIGGNLSSGDVTNLCHEENTYLNTIAGVSSGVC